MQVPGLAVVLVGSRKDSETYVRNKKKACEEVGIASFGETLPEEATEEVVLKASLQHSCGNCMMPCACIFYFQSHLLMLWQIC